MVHTDLKFFTNEPERDLYSRFAAILKSNTQFFDILVGYFRASGFFKMYKSWVCQELCVKKFSRLHHGAS